MSINVSSRQFNDPNLIDILAEAEKKYSVDPTQIKLEVTERVFQEGPVIMETVNRCRERGYSISLDDFGTGYSSLTSLYNMNVNTIKVDRTFVSSLIRDKKAKAIVQALISMSKGLNLDVVAEGIESHQEAFVLKGMGCKLGQGYLYSKPQSVQYLIEAYGKIAKAG